MKRILMAVALMVAGVFTTLVGSEVAFAGGTCPDGKTTYVNSVAECGINAAGDDVNKNPDGLMGVVKTIINVVLSVVGIIAVVMIILGGITFMTSQGDSAKVAKGKNTLIYGVVGLIVALLAFAIVNFVLKSVFNGTGAGDTQQVEGDV